MKIIAITQARIGSSRLPGKVLKQVNGKSLLQIHLERALRCKDISELIVATTLEEGSDAIVDIAKQSHCSFYKGSTNDVLDRFYQAAKPLQPDFVVRITSDCPLIDHEVMSLAINTCVNENLDYVSNTLNPTWPDGMDVEVFKFSALEKAWNEATELSDREHVTPYIWRNSTSRGGHLFTSKSLENKTDFSDYRLTVDYESDYLLIEKLITNGGTALDFMGYINMLKQHQEWLKLNNSHQRNEGYVPTNEQAD